MSTASFGTSTPAFPGLIRKYRGFTLAEVLVTSVIVASLAAVAVPVYNGYVTSQRKGAATNIAKAAAAAAGIFKRRTDAAPVCTHSSVPDCVELLNIFLSDPAQYWIDISGTTVTVTDRINAGITGTAAF